MVLVVVLSLLAAFLFAAAATIQQRATRIAKPPAHPPDEGVRRRLPVISLLSQLVHSKLWMLGWLTNLLGFFTQAAALHRGSVALVQPLMATQLLFTLPLVSIWSRIRPQGRDLLSGLLVVIGVAVFLTSRGPINQSGDVADRQRVLLACAAAAGLVILLVVVATAQKPLFHSAGIAVAAGLCFAVSAVLTKLTTADLLDRGIGATAVDWVGYALALSTLVGLLLEQEAFRAGPLSISIAAMSITNPMASYIIGVLAFNEQVDTSARSLTSLVCSLLLLFLGVAGLAASKMVQSDIYESVTAQRETPPTVRP